MPPSRYAQSCSNDRIVRGVRIKSRWLCVAVANLLIMSIGRECHTNESCMRRSLSSSVAFVKFVKFMIIVFSEFQDSFGRAKKWVQELQRQGTELYLAGLPCILWIILLV